MGVDFRLSAATAAAAAAAVAAVMLSFLLVVVFMEHINTSVSQVSLKYLYDNQDYY